MEKTMRKLWMPVSKGVDGKFIGILSDTSLDRDDEFMCKELLEDWAMDRSPLPMLANHENKMEKFVGGWKNKKLVRKGNKHALTANPFFFSKEANPLADQIRKQVEEALENGMGVGISIGAIPHEQIEKEIDGVMRTGFKKAEIVEATIVPIQSNRNASFASIAKEFDLNKNKEVNKMTEPIVDAPVEDVKEEVAPVEEAPKVEEPKTEEKPVEEEEAKEEPKTEEAPKEDLQAEVDAAKAKVAELQKELTKIKETVILKAEVEHPGVVSVEVDNAPFTIEKQLAFKYK